MIKTNPLSVKDIADIARRVREDYKIKNGDCFPILEYINYLYDQELLGIAILDDNDPYLDKDTPAVYNAVDNFIYLKESVINEIENGKLKLSKALQDSIVSMIQGNREFYLIDEQKVAYETAKKLVKILLKMLKLVLRNMLL